MNTIDATVRQQVVIAALTATGAQREGESTTEWEARAAMNAANFAAILTNEQHPVMRAVEQVAGPNTKVFTGKVVSIVKEESSTRGIVTLYTGTTRTDDGTEIVRTDRTDNIVGQMMARKVRSLVGQDVTVWVEIETIASGKRAGQKARVLRHVAVRD